jgi:hypothetical protein
VSCTCWGGCNLVGTCFGGGGCLAVLVCCFVCPVCPGGLVVVWCWFGCGYVGGVLFRVWLWSLGLGWFVSVGFF